MLSLLRQQIRILTHSLTILNVCRYTLCEESGCEPADAAPGALSLLLTLVLPFAHRASPSAPASAMFFGFHKNIDTLLPCIRATPLALHLLHLALVIL